MFSRCLAAPFYRAHAGFFCLAGLALFGIVPPEQLPYTHVQLIRAFLHAPWWLIAVWVAYDAWAVSYCRRLLRLPEYAFLRIADRRSFAGLLAAHFWILAPAAVYTVFAALVAVGDGAAALAGLFAAAIVVLWIGGAWVLGRSAGALSPRVFLTPGSSWAPWRLRAPRAPRPIGAFWALWPLRALWSRRRGLLVFVQLFSLGILCVARPGDDLFDLFFPFVLGATAIPLYYAVHFLERDLSFVRNMPLTTGSIGARLLLIQAILFLPEGIMLRNPLWYCLGLAQGALFIGMLFVDAFTMGRFIRIVLVTVFGTICLTRWNPLGAALIEGGAGAALFFTYYKTATYPVTP